MASAGVLSVMTSCTPQPSPTEKGVQVSELADYTIVYPSEYTEFRMDIVSELQDVIKHLTNVRINAIPDTEPEAEKEIILASSKRTTSFDAEIDDFASRMDYIVAKDNAFVMVDVYDNAVVNVIASDRAKVCVNHHGGKVIQKATGDAVVKIREKSNK